MASVELMRNGACITEATNDHITKIIQREHTAPVNSRDRWAAEARCGRCPAWQECLQEASRLAEKVDPFTWTDPDVIYGGLWGRGTVDERVVVYSPKKNRSRFRPLKLNQKGHAVPDLQSALDRALTLRGQGVFEEVG